MISPSTIIILVVLYLGYRFYYKPFILNAPKDKKEKLSKEPEPKKGFTTKSSDDEEYIDFEEVD